MGDIAQFFNKSDFACQCGCGFDDIDKELVEILDKIRIITKQPLIVNCGCRCEYYNKNRDGKTNSAHLRGKAADIRINDSQYRYDFIAACYSLGIRRMVLHNTYIHIDIDGSLPQGVFVMST